MQTEDQNDMGGLGTKLTQALALSTSDPSLLPRPHVPPGKKQFGEQSQISWAYYPKVVMTNEIARSVIIT